jgi:Predicted amidohydrolase
MKLALAQTNSVVGDLDGNAARIVHLIERARDAGADLVLLPELVVTGYPPEDLLLRPGFIRAAQRAVESIAESVHGITALVGAPHQDTELRNACFVLADGAIQAVYRKHHLPNYGVFDEARYFKPATTRC